MKTLSAALLLLALSPCFAWAIDRNTSGQKITLVAYDTAAGTVKTGDAANLTFYVAKDDGTVTALTDTSASEVSSTNDKGSYVCDLTQGETDAVKLRFSGKSTTSGVEVIAQTIYTLPSSYSTVTVANNAANANVTYFGGSAGTFASGIPAVNTTKVNGTAQTAGDIVGSINRIGPSTWTDAPTSFALVSRNYAGSSTGINVTTSNTNMIGATLFVAVVNCLQAGNEPVLSDSARNTWTKYATYDNGWLRQQVYYCVKPTVSATQTFTVTSEGKSPSVFVAGFSGVLSIDAFDLANHNNTAVSTTVQPGSITPSGDNSLVICTDTCGGSGTPTLDSGFTYQSIASNASGNNFGGGLGYKIQSAAAAVNPTWTNSGGGNLISTIISFKVNTVATTLGLASFDNRRIFPRSVDQYGQQTHKRRVTFSGDYTAVAPASVEIATYAYGTTTIKQPYTKLDNFQAYAGLWTGDAEIPEGGWYTFRAKSKNVAGEKLYESNYSNGKAGVGPVYLVVGQSNGYRLFQDYYVSGSAAVADDLTAAFTAGVWATNTGEGATSLANALSAKLGCPVGLANYAVSVAGIVYDAGSGEWQSQTAGKPWPLAEAGIAALGGDIEGVILQGYEADAENPSLDIAALKAGTTTLYDRIVAATPRTAASLPLYICIPGPLNDPATTDAKWDSIRTMVPAWADATEGAIVAGSLADGTLADAYHFGGADYAHNGLRLAQSILYHDGLVDNAGRSPQIFKAWRFSGSPIIYVQHIGLGNSGLAEEDGTTDGASLTGYQVSDDAWSTTETISSTAIEGNIVKLTLSSTPSDGATVVVRSQYGKTPTITNLPYRNANPQGDDRGLPLMPSGQVSVELRTAFASSTDTLSIGTLNKRFPLDIGYKLKTANGALSLARSTSNINLLSENETAATYSTYSSQSSGAVVWDDGSASAAEQLRAVGTGGGSGTLTDSDFENVPTTRTWKLTTNASNELVGDKTLVLKTSTGEKTFAIDFAVDLSVNGKISTVDSVAIATGTLGGVEFGTSGRERNLAKVRITGVTAGTYTITCKVTDSEGNPHTGTVTLKVVE